MSLRDYSVYISTTHIHRVAAFLFVALLGVGFGVGFSIAANNARDLAGDDYDHRLAIFSRWQMDLTSHFTKASSIAATVGAFIMATASTPANMSASKADRMVYLDQGALDRLGSQVYIKGISTMMLAPGGVVTQMYPPGSASFGFDMLSNKPYVDLLPILSTTSGLLTTGPSKLATRPGYAAFVWFPVHISNVTTLATFWGVASIMIEISVLLEALNISKIMALEGMHFAMWVTSNTAANGTAPTVIAQSTGSDAIRVMREGLRMQLPISEAGRKSYLAIYPVAGPMSPNMTGKTAAAVALATMLGSALIVLLVYLATYAHFMHRHRHAPPAGAKLHMAAFTLRGAQPIADRSALEAMRMFNAFTAVIRTMAVDAGCYPICEIGDRCVYVVSKTPGALMSLAQQAVLHVSVQGTISPVAVEVRSQIRSPASPSIQRSVSYARTRTAIASLASDGISQSSFIGAVTCHPSAACHTVPSTREYDAAGDVYFYGSAVQLSKLCAAVDSAKMGEVCWTSAFEEGSAPLCRSSASSALTTHTISENGEVILHVASWLRETGDEGDAEEDPSTAMAVISDAYVRKMTAMVSEGRGESRERRRKVDGADTQSGSSQNEITSLARLATVLHVALLSGDDKESLDIIRHLAAEEKGTLVSAHKGTIVIAFNLLSAGGHHQVRAASTVMRLLETMPNAHFACSINHGPVSALISDGLVMCSGIAVDQGWALLQSAIHMSAADADEDPLLAVAKRRSKIGSANGLCLLSCYSELGSFFECEAVDVDTLGAGKLKIIYRLAFKRSARATDDEWMYRLKDDEDQSPFAAINAVFARVAAHDLEEAARLWRLMEKSDPLTSEVSSYSKASIMRLLHNK